MYLRDTMCVPEIANLAYKAVVSMSARIISRIDVPTMRVRVVLRAKFDEEGVLSDVRGYTLQLKRLEAGPSEEGGVGRGESTEVLRNVLVR